MKASQRVYGLDILRAFAILFVIYSHSFFLIIDHINEKAYNIFSLDGVTLFFVLSGFLIGGILLKIINTTEFTLTDLRNFWLRRWLRTLPNYFFMLLILVVLFRIMNGSFPEHLLPYIIFLQNFAGPHPAFFPEAWSLSVEEWFYLMVPFGLYLSIRISGYPKKWILLGWTLAIILLVTAFRCYRAVRFGITDFETWDNFQRKLVLTRLDSIMFGFLGAWVACYYREYWTRWKKPLLSTGIILLFIPSLSETVSGLNMHFNNYVSLSLTSMATLMVLPALSELKNGKGPVFTFLTFVSKVSYSMYLVNFSLVQLTIIPSLTTAIVFFTNDHLAISIIRYCLYWLFTFILSWLLYRFFEKPVMEWRDTLGKGRG